MKCGLLGRKLGHSYSPQIHKHLGDYSYELWEKEPEELDAFFEMSDFDAMNVTIPYKESVMKYCSHIDKNALSVGSVNTVVKKDGELYGYNTDYFGFKKMLLSLCGNEEAVYGKKVLVLGSGGSSKTVCAVVKDLGGYPVVISRTGENNYENISLHFGDTSVIVNTTPVGMFPKNLECLIDLEKFNSLTAVADIIYNPSKTKLLLDAEKLGIPFSNGLYMLVAQAVGASELFCEKQIDHSVISEITDRIRYESLNIVLVGMPGCGKTTVGRKLAKLMGREFVDSDIEFSKKYGKTAAEVIRESGEAEFRHLETEILKELCRSSSLVIATGGGAVTVPENYPILHQNSIVVYLKRRLENLSTANRPLSQKNSPQLLFKKRAPLYESFSDVQLMSTEDPLRTAKKITELYSSAIKGEFKK